ncbi:MAG: glycosyltransferase [Deltaproteobacteria bacterium]|nr:glycosyltransferase [Deltaproteobacteria bacterium]
MPCQVVQILQSFRPGGLEKMVLSLCKGLRKRNIRVSAIAICEDGPLRAEFEKIGVTTSAISKKEGFRPRVLLKIAAMLGALPNKTVVHTHHLGPFIYTAPSTRWLRLRHIHTEHSHEFYHSRRRQWVGRNMERFARVTCVSKEISEHRKRVLVSDSQIVVNGVEHSKKDDELIHVDSRRHRQNLGLKEESFVVGVVGRLSYEKGVDRAIEGVALVENLNLVVVGDGAERTRLEQLSKSLGISHRVFFIGWQDNVRSWLAIFDVVLVPSRREGLPLAVLEAMHEGVPFLSSPVGEMPSLSQKKCGVVVNGDAQSFASALEFLRKGRAELAKMAKQARCVAVRDYSVDEMVERYMEIYQERLL